MKAYDPFPRTPTTAQRVRVCAFTRAYRPEANGAINMPAPNAPRVKHVGKGKRRVKRVTFK